MQPLTNFLIALASISPAIKKKSIDEMIAKGP